MIGVISINRYSVHMNYGAALHSFAFQKYLDKLDIDNIIINYFPRFMNGYNLKYPIKNKSSWKGKIRWVVGGYFNRNKYNKFETFFEKNCRFTKEIYTCETIKKASFIKNNITTFICESDVIWKPASTRGIDHAFFLDFPAANKAMKIAYAASVGLKMSDEEKEQVKRMTQSFHAISVREKDSIDFIKGLSNKSVEWVIDPTLLLTKDDYLYYARLPKEQNYLLVYNCMINDKRMLAYAKQTAKKLGLKLIEISSFPENHILHRHTVKTGLGIEEFLGYFANASYIICNAFHGSCFSLIFEKNFQLFQREEYDYRLKSIITPLEIEEVYVSKNRNIEELPIIHLDYNEINKKLSNFREQSHQFIIDALK